MNEARSEKCEVRAAKLKPKAKGRGVKVGEDAEMLAGMAEEAGGIRARLDGAVTDRVGDWLAARYVASARKELDGAKDTRRWEVMRAFVRDWRLLRRSDHSAARLELEREKFDWLRANSQSEKEKEFWEWTKKAAVREKLYPDQEKGISEETLRKIEKELRLF